MSWLHIEDCRDTVVAHTRSIAIPEAHSTQTTLRSSTDYESITQAILTVISSTPHDQSIHGLCQQLSNVVMNLVDNPTPAILSALVRMINIRPDAYPSLMSSLFEHVYRPMRDLVRICPLVLHIFMSEKLVVLWADLHQRLINVALRYPEIGVEVAELLCKIHGIHIPSAFPSTHPGFMVVYHNGNIINLIDCVFSLDIDYHGADVCIDLAKQLVALGLDNLCRYSTVEPSCRSLLYLFSLDICLAADSRIVFVLAWVMYYHSGLQTDRDLCCLLDLIRISIDSLIEFGASDPKEFEIAIGSLRAPLLELLSSQLLSKAVMERASLLFNLTLSCLYRPSTIAPHSPSCTLLIDVWRLPRLSPIVHLLSTLTSVWPSNLDNFLHRSSNISISSDYDIRTSRFTLGLLLSSGPTSVIAQTMAWLESLAKQHSAGLLVLFPVMLYSLRNNPDAAVRLHLLYGVTALARSVNGATYALRIILPIGRHPSLHALFIRLLFFLWTNESRSSYRLHQALLDNLDASDEVRVAISASLYGICQISGPQALPLVPLLQSLLEDHNTSTVALSLLSLKELCQQYLLDFHIVFAFLERRQIRQFCVGREPFAIINLFRLYESVLIEYDEEDHDSSNSHMLDILQMMWSQTCPISSPSIHIRLFAYRSLIAIASYFACNSSAEFQLSEPAAVHFFGQANIIAEAASRIHSEKSGRIRPLVERLIGIMCALQLQYTSVKAFIRDTDNQSPNDITGFLDNASKQDSCREIVKSASSTISSQWRSVSRSCARDTMCTSMLTFLSSRPSFSPSVQLDYFVEHAPSPNFSRIGCIVSLAISSSWIQYMDAVITALTVNPHSTSGHSTYVLALEQEERQLLKIVSEDSRCLGNTLMALAGVAVKAGGWSCYEISTRIHDHIMSYLKLSSLELGPAHFHLMPAAILALSYSLSSLHPTDDARKLATVDLISKLVYDQDSEIASAACICLGIIADQLADADGPDAHESNNEQDNAQICALLSITDLLESLAFSSSKQSWSSAVALCMLWAPLCRVCQYSRLSSIHDHILEIARSDTDSELRSGAFFSLGQLSWRLYSVGIISGGVLSAVVDLYLHQIAMDHPDIGACIAAVSFCSTLQYSSNLSSLPKHLSFQVCARLLDIAEGSTSSMPDDLISSCIIGIVGFTGMDILYPFRGAVNQLLLNHPSFSQIGSTFYEMIKSHATSATMHPQIVVASTYCLGLISSIDSGYDRAALVDAKRIAPSGSLLRIICSNVERRSSPTDSVLASIIRALLHIAQFKKSVQIPISPQALVKLLPTSSHSGSMPLLAIALYDAIIRLVLRQARYQDSLKRAIADLISPPSLKLLPVSVHHTIFRSLSEVIECLDRDTGLSLISLIRDKFTSSLYIEPLLTGFRRIITACPDNAVKLSVINLLSNYLCLQLPPEFDTPLFAAYSACFSSISIADLDNCFPVRLETPANEDRLSWAIAIRCDLVRRGVIDVASLIPIRTLIVGPEAHGQSRTIGIFADSCAKSIPSSHRLSWILNLFDLAAASHDPTLALHVLGVMVTSWSNPLISGDVETLSYSLPQILHGWDDMSVDSIVRRLARFANPSPDDVKFSTDVRSAAVPSLIAVAECYPRCASVILSELYAAITN